MTTGQERSPHNRREFLRLGLTGTLGLGALGMTARPALAGQFATTSTMGAPSPSRHRHIPRAAIGMHLYTMRDPMADDASGTLAQLHRIGYRRVGVSGKYGYSPDEFRSLLDGADLRAVITHRNLDDIRADAIHQTIEDAHVLGVNHIVVRSLPVDNTPDAYRQAAELFNQAGEVTHRNGLGLLFHNHAGNFDVVEGVRLYDVLLEHTDPSLVGFEFDIYWAAKAGVDIVRMWEENPGRFPVLHVKDMAADGSITDVGSGVIDFPRIFDSCRTAGVRQWLVEHDNPSDPFATARNSYQYLANLTF